MLTTFQLLQEFSLSFCIGHTWVAWMHYTIPRNGSMVSKGMAEWEILHSCHYHPLRYWYECFEFRCDVCRELGYGLRYWCERCRFDIHKSYVRALERIDHPSHSQHKLVLREELQREWDLPQHPNVSHVMYLKEVVLLHNIMLDIKVDKGLCPLPWSNNESWC